MNCRLLEQTDRIVAKIKALAKLIKKKFLKALAEQKTSVSRK